MHLLPTEILLMIMIEVPDIVSLDNLVRACELLAQVFAAFSEDVFPVVLARCMPRDLQELVCLIISMSDAAPFPDSQIDSVLKKNVFFCKEGRKGRECLFQFSRKPKDSLKALHRVSRVTVAVQFFTALFPIV